MTTSAVKLDGLKYVCQPDHPQHEAIVIGDEKQWAAEYGSHTR